MTNCILHVSMNFVIVICMQMSTYVSLTAQESQPLSTKEIISTGIDIKSLVSATFTSKCCVQILF